MPLNLQTSATWWNRIQGDSVAAGDGSTSGTPARIDSFNSDLGAQADAIASSDTATASFISLFRRLLRKIPDPTVANTANTISATNAAATITYAAAGAGVSHLIDGTIAFSYSGTPATTGTLSITDNGVTVLSVDVVSGGAGFLPIKLRGTTNTALVVSLSAGGAGIVGKVTVLGKGLYS